MFVNINCEYKLMRSVYYSLNDQDLETRYLKPTSPPELQKEAMDEKTHAYILLALIFLHPDENCVGGFKDER